MKGDKVVERSKKLLHLAKKLYMQGLQYPHKVNIRCSWEHPKVCVNLQTDVR